MATETLKCESCDRTWEREVKRGRKPKTCPECKNKPKEQKSKPVTEEALKKAERKYKQRVQVAGKHFKTIGKGKRFVGNSGTKLMIYDGFEFEDGTVTSGTIVREKGFRDQYKFRSLAVRDDGTAYANLIGVGGTYQGKHRAIGIGNITL